MRRKCQSAGAVDRSLLSSALTSRKAHSGTELPALLICKLSWRSSAVPTANEGLAIMVSTVDGSLLSAAVTSAATDKRIDTAVSMFGMMTRRTSAASTAWARAPRGGGRAGAAAVGSRIVDWGCGDSGHRRHRLSVIVHGRCARRLAACRGHGSVGSDVASPANHGRLTAARRASVEGAQHRDRRDAEAAAGTLAASSARGAGAERRAAMREWGTACRSGRRSSPTQGPPPGCRTRAAITGGRGERECRGRWPCRPGSR